MPPRIGPLELGAVLVLCCLPALLVIATGIVVAVVAGAGRKPGGGPTQP